MENKFYLTGLLAASMLAHACTVPNANLKNKANTPSLTSRVLDLNWTYEYLSPKESLKTFSLPKGYKLELVASEPMIKEPVAIAWDGNAKMYVAEMLTYMQDADATGEQVPRSRISLLEDTDKDGKMDKSTVFVDSLLLPRMLLCMNNELLVNETNTITITAYKDSDSDGRADSKRIVYQNAKYSANGANMEHQRSGLDWNLDNWMYMTYEPIRLRYTNGILRGDTIVSGSGGQWGITHDNYGRLFYSSAGGEIPVQRFQVNPVYGILDFNDQFTSDFAAVWPIIATPDVQGGLGRLRPDSTLNHFTASCGQSIYRGNALPKDLIGDYLVCEPVGRLIRRAKVLNLEGKTVVQNAYNRQEFIASTDMNFRPVNTYTGPDGNVYIVDMHRGIIQQGTWTSPGSFLRKVIDRMGLAKNIGHGRIYRLVHDDYKSNAKPRMLNESTDKLVAYLDHPNGWWRDNAQKEIMVRGDKSVVPSLRKMASGHQATLSAKPSHLGRIHALWALEGLGAIDKDIVLTAMQDQDPQVRKTAVWISEPYIKKNDAQVIEKLGELGNDSSADVRVQVVLSLSYGTSNQAKALFKTLAASNQQNEMIAASLTTLEKNQNTKLFGSRLANMPAADRNLVLKGAAIYKQICSTCHGPEGKGLAIGGGSMPAPPFVGSQRVSGDKSALIRILLHGLSGPIDGKNYSDIMAPLGAANDDEWVASVLSYIRHNYGRIPSGRPTIVSVEDVKSVRGLEDRTKPWTLDELEKAEQGESGREKAGK